MSPGDESSLAGKVFHLNVKDNMARYFLISNRNRVVVGKDFESNANVLHFLGNTISPKGVTKLFVYSKGLLDGLRQFNAKLVCPFQITRVSSLDERNNTVAFLQDMRHPPIKGGLVVNAEDLGIFGGLNRMGFLEVNEVLP